MNLKKMISLALICLLMLALFAACGETSTPDPEPPAETEPVATPEPEADASDEAEPVELLVGAAMSLYDVTKDLAEAYQAENPHVTLDFTYASSGALQGQIEEGAPIDIFMSAAAAQMWNLEEQGLIYGTGRNVVTNTVALIVPADSDLDIESFADLASDHVGIVGVGDPEAMPIGRFAQEVFVSLEIDDVVYEKAVLGSDVRQILTWVELGEVDAGVVFMTDAITSEDVRVIEVADGALHSPSVNPVGIVETSAHREAAQSFIDFLFSDAARAIFERHGFTMYA